MNKRVLLGKLKRFAQVEEKKLYNKSIPVKDMTFTNLRDSLLGLGKILDEDFDRNIYVINVPAGLGNMNAAMVATQLNGRFVDCLAYSKEGIINQHTAEKAVAKIKKRLKKYTD